MKSIILKSVLLIGLTSGTAVAGNFEIWHDASAKSSSVTAVVSFAGDGNTQDAQADIAYPMNWKLEKATAKVAGSVCVGHANANKIRVVPPSGAGSALSSKATDYCAFSFTKLKGAESKGEKMTIEFTECQGISSAQGCSAEATDLSIEK